MPGSPSVTSSCHPPPASICPPIRVSCPRAPTQRPQHIHAEAPFSDSQEQSQQLAPPRLGGSTGTGVIVPAWWAVCEERGRSKSALYQKEATGGPGKLPLDINDKATGHVLTVPP